MKTKTSKILVRFTVCIVIVFTACQRQSEADLIFLVAADWRFTATEKYHTPEYFMGALQAIEEVGKGSFMVSPGDVEPVASSRELIARVLGQDYIWYPVIGNHELDSPEYLEYLRAMNPDGRTLPNIVRTGPPGTIETTYSFDWGDCHFVVLNQYFDGQSDEGTDGDIVPELLEWLEQDLAENTKQHVFVIGHEPMIALPDMNSGRIRHQGDSLDKYAKNMFRFHQVMLKYDVIAYICGHTHNTSIGQINGIWQIDAGHARGIEDPYPQGMYEGIKALLGSGTGETALEEAIRQYYQPKAYSIKKVLYYTELTDGVYYKVLDDARGFQILKEFYITVDNDPSKLDGYCSIFRENFGLTRSTFIRILVAKDEVKAEFYRNDAMGGEYSLVLSETLN